jgi:hypothetical protein
MLAGYWWEWQKERDHWESLDVGERIIVKRILEIYDGDWSG